MYNIKKAPQEKYMPLLQIINEFAATAIQESKVFRRKGDIGEKEN
jgi:hypothetical protein